MKLFGRNLSLPRFLSPRNSTTLSSPADWLISELLGRMAASGVQVTPLRALGVATVYACVNTISRTMTTLPVSLNRRVGSGPTNGWEPAIEHPMFAMFDEPNEDMTGASFIYAVQANATLRNVGYALIVRNGLNQVSELVPIEPSELQIVQSTVNGPISYKVNGKLVDKRSLLIINGMTFNGVSPAPGFTLARENIGLAIALQDNAARFFGNGSRPGGTLEHPQTLSDAAQERLRSQVESIIRGPDKAYNLLILEEGLKFNAQRDNNETSQFNESRIYQDKAIARHFGVQQHKVGILDNAHFNNVEQENINYVTDTILPWVRQWEQELNRKTLTRDERRLYSWRFNVDGLLRGDAKSRAEALQIQLRNGVRSRNEWRRLENLNPVPGGDTFLIDQTLVEPGKQPAVAGARPTPPVEPTEDQE